MSMPSNTKTWDQLLAGLQGMPIGMVLFTLATSEGESELLTLGMFKGKARLKITEPGAKRWVEVRRPDALRLRDALNALLAGEVVEDVEAGGKK